MALNGDRLGTAIKAAIDGVGDKSDTEAVWQAIAGAIVSEFTINGVVNPAGGPPPLTAPAGGGPVTGTGTIL